jgi:thiosulfate/3-mercaptopyruvate sulfurtransferase
VLDGGLAAWPGELETSTPERRPTIRTPVPWPSERIVDADAVAAGGAPVLDARAPERYRGESEPIDARAGHIPGAANVPWTANLGDGGRFRTPETLRSQFAAAGVHDGADQAPIAYCGSGVTACHVLLALEVAGLAPGRLYAGSWSQWSAHPERPAATGS